MKEKTKEKIKDFFIILKNATTGYSIVISIFSIYTAGITFANTVYIEYLSNKVHGLISTSDFYSEHFKVHIFFFTVFMITFFFLQLFYIVLHFSDCKKELKRKKGEDKQ